MRALFDRTNLDVASMLLNTITGLHVLSRLEPRPDRLTRVVDATLALL